MIKTTLGLLATAAVAAGTYAYLTAKATRDVVFAEGGAVWPSWRGHGDVDNVPVLLTRGLLVVPSAVMAHYGREALEKMAGPYSDVESIDELMDVEAL